MAEYTRAIDAQISQLLQQRGGVTPDMLAGVDLTEGAALLARYVEVHAHEVAFVFDGQRLTWAQAAPAAPPPIPALSHGAPPMPPYAPLAPDGVPRPAVSAVDQILSAPPQGKALLDVEPSGGPYPKWAWWPPLLFGLLGGLFSWFVVRDANPKAAFKMLMTGLVVQVVSGCIALMMIGSIGPTLNRLGAAGQGSAWPPSQSQRATFYYFGTST